jgi:Mg-chelatase subunit ChlD
MFDLGLTFARPVALWLLAAVPLFFAAGWLLGVRRRALPRAALWLRLLVVGGLVFAIAEPLLTTGGGAVSTVFLVDRSQSLAAGTGDQVNGWVSDALVGADAVDRAAIVTFGASPTLAQPAARADDIGGGWQDVGPDATGQEYTDIASALALARALPLGGSRRIVLLSDGAENVGSALDQASQAAEDAIPIDVVVLPGVGESDLRVQGASAPTSVWQGEPFDVLASVVTGVAGEGQVEVLIDGVPQEPQVVSFPVGLSTYKFRVDELDPGFHAITVRVSGSQGDAFPQNNELPLALVVRDAPRILLVSPESVDPGLLAGALQRRGAQVTLEDPTAVPSLMPELGQYDAIILNNVAAGELSLEQQIGLQEAARKLGKGLIVVGGTNAFGPGNYAGTALEEALPVTVKTTDGRQRERVAVLLIMDKSGSMSYDPLGGTSKIDMAKEGVRLAAQSLSEGDVVGILVFNDEQTWVFPMTEIIGQETRDQINAAVETITADGGTEIYPALSAGFNAIRGVDADVRHIVLLTDGKSRTGTRESYQRLIEDAAADNVTLSTIAIGSDSDTELLQFLAERGGGRYYFTDNAEDIPSLTLEEAQSAGSQAVLRGNFKPIQVQPSPILLNFTPDQLPNLDGYDYAEPKPNAQVILQSDRDDPVLAKWQYGLGRVIAWTSDDGVDLAQRWAPTAWQRYDEFWWGMVGWALPDPENRPMEVSVERDGPEAIITVDAVGEGGDFVDLADTTATITTPSGAVDANRTLHQTGPGRYQLRVAAPESGAYRIELNQVRDGQQVTELSGFAVPPSPELQPSPGAPALLSAIAARTGGRVLTLSDASVAFAGDGLSGTPLKEYRSIWYVPLALALIGLLAEIAVRTRFFPWLTRRTG